MCVYMCVCIYLYLSIYTEDTNAVCLLLTVLVIDIIKNTVYLLIVSTF